MEGGMYMLRRVLRGREKINMNMIFNMMLLLHLFSLLVFGVVGQNECKVTRCKHDGPIIRFPFRTKDQPEHCGYPGFQLYCDISNSTKLEFQYQANTSLRGLQLSFSLEASVQSIDYRLQRMDAHYFHPIQTPAKLQLLNTQNSTPFKAEVVTGSSYNPELTILNCSAKHYDDVMAITSLNGQTDLLSTISSRIKSCTKMYTVSFVPLSYYDAAVLITWDAPNYHGPPINKAIAGEIGGPFFILLLFVAFYYVIKTNKQKKEDRLKIEMFLADYKALKPTRYSYVDIRKIANQFKEKIGQGGYGSVYKGQLSGDVLVAVKVLNNADSKGNGEEFINEVSTIGLIHHVNVVRLVGYCADGSNRALVYEFLPNNSLEKFVCSGRNHNNRFLGWEKLQKIALGIAKGIEYLHQGCAQRILHFDIKPHNILLDQNFNPKISDFGLAKLCSKGQSLVSMTMARGTIGYIAPEVFSRNFGKVSSKSDVYSFGMLLLEMVGEKDNAPVGTESSDETYFPEWIFHRLEQGGELTIQIEEEVDSNIARKLTIVGLWCIGWHPVDRPSMKHVIQMLEAEDCPAIPPNPFSSTSSRNATPTTHARPFTNELEAISESE